MAHATRIKLVALIVLALSLISSGMLSPMIAASVGRHKLAYTDLAEHGDPPQVALGIAMGAFRGVFVNFLWIRANKLKEDGKYYESIELSRAITRLQPRFQRVWVFHAWNMAYNISVATQTAAERWQWVNAGVRLLRDEGIPANPNNMLLHKELAWFYLHKIGGYTDDANGYYKRQIAEEWQIVLGLPPERDQNNRSRERRIEQFMLWLRPIVDAPDSLDTLAKRNATAAALAGAFEQRLGEPIGMDLLRRHALFDALDRAGRVESTLERIGPKGAAFHELLSDPELASGWDDLLAHTRKRVLRDEYNMDPLRMYRLTERFGPIDWRVPAAHAVYWAYKGVDQGHMEVTPDNVDSLEFVNTYRIVAQGLQDLWRYGDLYFNFLEVAEGRRGFYQPVPNPYFVASYGEIFEETFKYGGIFENQRNPYNVYAAGYENFLQDAIAFFYRRGDIEQAEHWYTELRTWGGQNMNATRYRPDEMSVSVGEFVQTNLVDRMDSPNIAVAEFASSLQGAFYEGLLQGNDETFWGLWNYARQVHAHFKKLQHREVIAGGDTGRMEFIDRDFRWAAGSAFAQIIINQPPDEAELLYFNAGRIGGEDLQKFAYDTLKERYKPLLEQVAPDRSFDDLFLEPEGMDRFRVWFKQQTDLRNQREVQGIEKD